MRRTVWSSDKFDRKLGTLFEVFEGNEKNLRRRLDEVIKSLLDGSLDRAQKRGTVGHIYSVPLVGNYVIVFSPGRTYRAGSPSPQAIYRAGWEYLDISETDHINLLNIERQRR
jgi:hypothetical protein